MQSKEIIDTLNKAYFSEQPHEQAILAILPKLLGGVTSFADIGASLGQFTRMASKSLKNGKIFAVEADPVRFEELNKNVSVWAQETGNSIVARHAAVTKIAGPVEFQLTGSSASGGLFRNSLSHLSEDDQAKVQWRAVTVEGVTLDSLFPNDPPDLVKMDIEGGELGALEGARRILGLRKTRFLVELHDFDSPDGRRIPVAVAELMAEYGYRAVEICGKSLFVQSPILEHPLWAIGTMARKAYRAVKGT